jgi:DNA mismatch endonuclease, patch repair protein
MAMSRSENMSRIRGRDTKPELVVRKMLRRLGFKGYRLHRKELPGKPDIVFIGRKKVIFVHGCFWHAHTCEVGARKPVTNQAYWVPKIQRNKDRDVAHLEQLQDEGWAVLTVWECEIKDEVALMKRLAMFLDETISEFVEC